MKMMSSSNNISSYIGVSLVPVNDSCVCIPVIHECT